MKKIISYSLWGDNPKYCVGALKNAESCKDFYPDWECIFYISNNVPEEYIENLRKLNSKIITLNEKPNSSFNVNRFLAMDTPNASRVIFRDTDSRFCQREVDAVNEWVSEDTALHVMKDHPYHGNFPILAGMFGLNKSKFPYSMSESINVFRKQTEGKLDNHYYFDQIFLQNFIWNNFENDCTIHDEFFHCKPYPSLRVDKRFVGESFEEDESRNEEHLKFIK
tara:strand:+ start:387 stop:1055 length:669 start_codon:yes stop_codon:yes gene_type:complete